MIWTTCPDCGSPAYQIRLGEIEGKPHSIEQVCLACGSISEDQHWTAEEARVAGKKEPPERSGGV